MSLVLVQPKKLSDDAQYAIDQFVLRGGHLLVFVDPLAETDDSGADPNNPQAAMFADKSSDLPKLFKAWGIEYDPKKVVLDRAHALQISGDPGRAAGARSGDSRIHQARPQSDRRDHGDAGQRSTYLRPASSRSPRIRRTSSCR